MLEITLLGSFDLQIDGERLNLDSRPSQKILSYLALHQGKSIPRVKLAGVIWPDVPEHTARKNLRHYLWRLRQAVGADNLLTTKNSVTFKPAHGFRLDVETLVKAPGGDDEGNLIDAVSAYRGELLPGFYDDWLQLERERLQAIFERRMQTLLDRLTAERRWSDLITWSEYWIAHGGTPEPAYRSSMQGYTGLGDLAGVATTYKRCKKALAEDLGVEPSPETTALYQSLMEGHYLPTGDQLEIMADAKPGQASTPPTHVPDFLQAGGEIEHPLFVGREKELARLNDSLTAMLDCQGQIVFLAGDAGSGKSSLMNAFSVMSGEHMPDLLVGLGTCNAFSGFGDPYLPFRKVLSALTGDLEGQWASGTVSRKQARSMWESISLVVEALLDVGPDLLDTIIPSSQLLKRLESLYPAGHPLVQRLQARIAEKKAAHLLERVQLFEQVTDTLRHLAKQRPVLILLDDLQWADRGSLDLFFHLARSLSRSRILMVAAYRPDEVAADTAYPLTPMLNEFRRMFGDVWLNLAAAADKAFVDALIDSEANLLDELFRQALYAKTRGHPLFTVELLRTLRDRGDLVRDHAGAWTARPDLDWQVLPVRVEGAIKIRLGRLTEALRDILKVAAVEGEVFTIQVVAPILGIAEDKLLDLLSRELQRRHQLVVEETPHEAGRRQLSRYRFTHALFQRFIYDDLLAGERRIFHQAIGTNLERLFSDSLNDVAVQLAHHFYEAGAYAQALPYIMKAGDNARMLYAFADALQHYEQALAILKEQENYEGAAQVLLKMGLTYHGAADFERSSQAYQESFLLLRQAREAQSTASTLQESGTVRTHSEKVSDLDPIMCQNLAAFRVCYQLFGRLVSLNRELDVIPDMAESWRILDNGRTYEFTLRRDLYWSDGQPLTAHDFAYRLQKDIDPGYGSPIKYRWNEIKNAVAVRQGEKTPADLGIEVPDQRTLRLHLEQPNGTFIQELIHLAPVPRHIVDKYGRQWTDLENIVSCGPFLIESWDHERAIVLARNSHYYGRAGGNVSQVVIRFVDDPADALQAYEHDQLDIVELPNDMHWASEKFADQYQSWPEFRVVKVNLNTHRFPFENPRIRRALVLATNRPLLAETAARGMVTPGIGSYIPLGLPGHRPDVGVPYDLEKARQILAEVGHPGGKGLPVITAAVPKPHTYLIDGLNEFWVEDLGLKVQWDILDWGAYHQRLEDGQVDLFMEGFFAATPNPDAFMGNLSVPREYWTGEKFRNLVKKARVITDPVARMKKYQEAEDILLTEIPLFPLFYWRRHHLIKPWIKDYRPKILFLDGWKDVTIEAY